MEKLSSVCPSSTPIFPPIFVSVRSVLVPDFAHPVTINDGVLVWSRLGRDLQTGVPKEDLVSGDLQPRSRS